MKTIKLIFILILMIGISCSKKSEEIIKIGAILSITGSGAEYGKDQQKAIDLLLKEVSNKSTKYKYEIIYQDSKSSPKDGVNALKFLLNNQKIDAVMTVLSSVSMAIKPITEKNKIPLFCVGANPQITKNSKYVFRSLPTSIYQAEKLAEKYVTNLDINTFGILYLNDDFGTGSKDSFLNAMKNGNNKIIADVPEIKSF